MKKWLTAIAMLLALLLAFSWAMAEPVEADDGDPLELANSVLHNLAFTIANQEDDEAVYTVSNGDYQNLIPGKLESEKFVPVLSAMKLVRADTTQEPEGERVALNIQDIFQYRFYLGEAEKNYVSFVMRGDDGEAVYLLQAEMPENWPMTVSDTMNLWVLDIANSQGLAGLPSSLHADDQHITDSPEWVTRLPQAQDENVTQLFVVAGIGMDKTTAYVSMHQRDDGGAWVQVLSTPGFVGKNGLCLDADHKEGCGQTPVGVYRFNKAFGIARDPGCVIPYFQVNDGTYWSGDPDYHYNEMVDISDYPQLAMDDSEHIVDYEYQYQYCLNISFNEEGTPGRGSAIFLHCLGPIKPWTGGCVAIPENMMKMVMQKVYANCVVVIDTAENLGITF